MEQTSVNIASTLGTAMQTTANSMMEAIGTVLPIALTIAGAVLVVFLGWKIFKRLAK